jgi:hypothetical protein
MSEDPAALKPGASEAQAAESPYAVLRNRNVLLYLVGRFVASLGQQMLTVAVGWELYERTGSALALGLVGLNNMLPMFLATVHALRRFVWRFTTGWPESFCRLRASAKRR